MKRITTARGPLRRALLAAAAAAAAASTVIAAGAASAAPAVRPHVTTCGSTACDWPEFHQSPLLAGVAPRSTVSTSDAGQLGVAWATNLYGAALDSPVVAYDATLGETLAYVGTENGDVEAVNVADGQIVWGTWLGAPIRTTPAVSGGAVWVGTFDSPRIYKLDAATGAVECSLASPQPIEGTPVVADPPGGVPTVYIGTNDSQSADGPILAINAANCALEWSFTDYLQRTGNWTAAAYGLDAKGEPLLVFGTADPDATLYGVDAVTGARVWTYTVYDPPPGVYDIGAGAVISTPGVNGFADGVVYVPSKYGIMYAVDLTTGALIWSTDFNQIAGYTGEDGRSTAALEGTDLVFGSGTGLFELDAVTGAVVWQYVDPTQTEALSSPAIGGPAGQEVVAVGELAGALDVVSLATGAQLYRYQTGGYITASPAISDGNVLIASADGFLYDFAAGGGNEATLPATGITAPADASTLPNPDGDLTIGGTAADGKGVAAVEVAIQDGGPAGSWWDAATGSWSPGPVDDPAVLASPGATSSSWSLSFPVPAAGGPFTVTAYAASTGGQSDVKGAHVGFTVLGSTKGARIKVTPAFTAPGSSFTVSGSGFKGGESVSVSLPGGAALATLTATSSGNLTAAKVKVPASAPFGETSVIAKGATSGDTAAAAMTVANAWPQQGYNAAHTASEPNDSVLYNLVHPGPNIFLEVAWGYQTGTPVGTSPAVVDGVAYVGDDKGHLSAVDLRNGAPMWTWALPSGAPIRGSPAADPSARLVIAGADDGTLDAVSTSTGQLVWSDQLGGDVSAPVLVRATGTVYVTTSSGLVEAVAETTGAKKWSTTLSSHSSAAPAYDGAKKVLVVGEANGHVQELSATTGALGWVFAASGAVKSSPAISGGSVYVGSTGTAAGGDLYALDESTGAQIWAYRTAGAVNAAPSLTAQLTPGGALEVVAGDAKGKLYFLAASNATLYYEISFSPGVTGVATARGVAVAELSGGLLTAARTYSDLDTWRFQTKAGLTTAPVVVDGAVYVGAGDGNLYAFTGYGQPPA